MKGNFKATRLVALALLFLLCLAIGLRVHSSYSKSDKATTGHSAKLSWNPSTAVVKGYNIYRATKAGGPYTRINPAVHPATTYVDSDVVAGATYYYVTTAVTPSGLESSYSTEVVGVIPRDQH